MPSTEYDTTPIAAGDRLEIVHAIGGGQAEDRAAFQGLDATLHYHALQIRDFLAAIIADRDPMVTGEEGRRSVELFNAIYRSHQSGGAIALPLH